MEYWPSLDRELRQAIKQGEVDFIAGYPTLSDNYQNDVDFIFDLALTYGLPVDLHVDESDEPNIDCFLYVLEKTIKTHMEGRVTCGYPGSFPPIWKFRHAGRSSLLCSGHSVRHFRST